MQYLISEGFIASVFQCQSHRREDGWKIVGMFLTFVVLALSLGFFSARRWRELALETAARERTEEELLEGKLRDGDARAAETARMLNDETAKRIEAQSALKMTEESFRDFLESASDLVQIVAPDGKIVYVNRAWKESLGYGDDDVRNLSIFDVVAPDHRKKVKYSCGPCKPAAGYSRADLPCVRACRPDAIRHSW